MEILKITDDSGFMGIANFDKYKSFISEDWDFEMIKKRIVEEMKAQHLLFWATGFGNTWKVRIDNKSSNEKAFREENGVIEVTNGELYLTNYESLTMAAQFSDVKLPEKDYENLVIKLDNGKFIVNFRQMFDPDEFDFDTEEVNFELILMKIQNDSEINNNNVNGIYWSDY